jgi:uncharacterized protein YecE (DUF72 family)
MAFPSNLLIGADGWNWDGWVGDFYPEGTAKSNYLSEYSRHYKTVEVDSSFYRIPSKATVRNWFEQTPDDFVFAVKVPRGVTHYGFQGDYKGRLSYFLEVMDNLGAKLGPLLFQFRYYRTSEFSSVAAFAEMLEPLLAFHPRYRFAVEIRNNEWIVPNLLNCLRRQNAAFVLVDHPWAEHVDTLMDRIDAVTADFAYIRWLGHHTKLEKLTDRWDRLLLDKTEDTARWVKALKRLLDRNMKAIYGYYRNRYAGYAPGSIELLSELWQREQ